MLTDEILEVRIMQHRLDTFLLYTMILIYIKTHFSRSKDTSETYSELHKYAKKTYMINSICINTCD